VGIPLLLSWEGIIGLSTFRQGGNVIDGYIYIIKEQGEVLYVGQSKHNPYGRLDSHDLNWPMAEAQILTTEEIRHEFDMTEDMGIDEIEGLMIALLNPSENRLGPDLRPVHPWPPGMREESPRRKRAKEIIKQLRSYKR